MFSGGFLEKKAKYILGVQNQQKYRQERVPGNGFWGQEHFLESVSGDRNIFWKLFGKNGKIYCWSAGPAEIHTGKGKQY